MKELICVREMGYVSARDDDDAIAIGGGREKVRTRLIETRRGILYTQILVCIRNELELLGAGYSQ